MDEWICKSMGGGTVTCELKERDIFMSLYPDVIIIETPKRKVSIESNWTGVKSEIFIKTK